MSLFKKHVDTVVVLGGILTSVLWMNAKFNKIENELSIIKTVLILKGIMPPDLIAKSQEKKLEIGEGS